MKPLMRIQGSNPTSVGRGLTLIDHPHDSRPTCESHVQVFRNLSHIFRDPTKALRQLPTLVLFSFRHKSKDLLIGFYHFCARIQSYFCWRLNISAPFMIVCFPPDSTIARCLLITFLLSPPLKTPSPLRPGGCIFNEPDPCCLNLNSLFFVRRLVRTFNFQNT